ncbi:TIGR02301 family protein [Chthonobacter albigriseus]|uniref:TIGR02301 family protein n=1 Tax=Chthonobacter albigriseus TaxID=1683161 RepID=UPI0015EF7884|nr:TIGR02301 family protein [Chthonobacter albigriseus]
MTRHLSTLTAVLFLAAAQPAVAQDQPPFAPDLLRFSEILGAVSYLDTLCGAPESGAWRRQMQALLDAQEMSPDDRRKYVDVYNRGHRTFATVHRNCTDQTRSVLRGYMAEGEAIATRLEQRFGRAPG